MSILNRILKSAPSDWKRDDLRNLTNTELEHISRLLGIPTSGTKDKKIKRILESVEARTLIAGWSVEDRFNLVKKYTQAQLKKIAQLAGTMHYGAKIQMITSLIIWRDTSRRTGAEYTEQYKAAMKADTRPRQTQLTGFADAAGSYTQVYTNWNNKTARNIRAATQQDTQQLELF